MAQLDIGTELLGPVARNSAANSEYSKAGLLKILFGKMVKVEEGIEANQFPTLLGALAVVQGYVQSHFRIGEGRDINRDSLLVSRAQDAASRCVLREILADGAGELVGTHNLAGIPGFEDLGDDAFDKIEIGLGLQSVVDAVVTGLVELYVVHLFIPHKMGFSGGFDEAVSHEGSGRDNSLDDSGVDEIGNYKPLLGYGHRSAEGHDDEGFLVAGHRFEHIGGVANLTAGECSLTHGADEVVNRGDFGEIKWVQSYELV